MINYMKNSFFRYFFLVAVLLSYTSVEAQQKAKDQSAEQQSHLLKPVGYSSLYVVEARRITRYFPDRAMGDLSHCSDGI